MNNDEAEKIKELSIQELLSGEVSYKIPLYQRNYAWKRGEIEQLIRDIIDYMNSNDKQDRNYYIGTLVVFEQKYKNRISYEVLDGQQRLTTLVLLVAYLKHLGKLVKHKWEWLDDFDKKSRPIHYQSRDDYRDALKEILTNKEVNTEKAEVSTEILDGYYYITDIFLEGVLSEKKQTLEIFCDFLLENVKIMRVLIPQDTDRHHYFEIMNNRGEQLEKHEILKFRMITPLDKESQRCFHIIWEACANMGNYVQIRFSEEQRNAVFGENWDSFCVKDFGELQEKINPKVSNDSNKRTEYPTLSEIINSSNQNGDDNEKNQNRNKNNKENENNNSQFNTIIEFPNFLLHVLRLHVFLCDQEKSDKIKQDDKELLKVFEDHILNDSSEKNFDEEERKKETVDNIKKFSYNLLFCKFLYDQYIIKINPDPSDETRGWSLKRLLKKTNDNSKSEDDDKSKDKSKDKYVHTFGEENNKRIIMLLSSLHVSETGSTKYWLDAALNHLVCEWKEKQNIEVESYLKHMEDVATSFVFDRSLSPNGDLDYFSIIYENNGVCQMKKEELSEKHIRERLSYGGIPRRIFHFLDYLLWLKYKDDRNYPKIKILKEGNFPKITDFEFTTSNDSVEHHFPQNPEGGGDLPQWLHLFGNLYLISRSKNSELSNKLPREKKKKYEEGGKIGSIKQYLMMMKDYQTKGETSTSNEEGETGYKWDESCIDAHYKEMKDLLLHWLETGTVETENPKDEEKEEHWK